MSKKLLILGCGYTGQFLSKKLISKGWQVFGTTRSEVNFKKLQKIKIQPIFWNDFPALENVLEQECSVLSCIGPQGLIDDGLSKIEKLLKTENARVNWLGYVSSTGVYGDRQGKWVDEESKLDTITIQGKARAMAEKCWLEFSKEVNIPMFIFRAGGIYGPDRSIFDRIKAGNVQKIIKPNQYFNRIHVDDLSGALGAGLESPQLAGTYNIVDDLPTSGARVLDEASRMLDIPFFPEVSFSDANLSEMAQSFYLESKRVSNKKLRKLLGYSLLFPTYVDGLRSLMINKSLD